LSNRKSLLTNEEKEVFTKEPPSSYGDFSYGIKIAKEVPPISPLPEKK
jgi:hypothetical protein